MTRYHVTFGPPGQRPPLGDLFIFWAVIVAVAMGAGLGLRELSQWLWGWPS